MTHPEAEPPEHYEDLVYHLRDKGYDPAAFDPGELTATLSWMTVRAAPPRHPQAGGKAGSRAVTSPRSTLPRS